MKRIVLFIVTNLAVMFMLSITARLLGIDSYLTQQGMNMGSLLVYAGIMGFGGAFISLAMSKWMAKMSTGAQVITTPQSSEEAWLLDTVRRQAQQAGIGMPEVAVYQGAEMNAFATGMSRNSALVAVSTGLLSNMTHDEVEAVLAHEVSHVANGDMVTLTLIQGVLNTFVIFIARIIGSIVDKSISREGEGRGIAFTITSLAAEIMLGILASLIVRWFSRWREFRADQGGASLAGSQKMIRALQRLQQERYDSTLPEGARAFGINNRILTGLQSLFSSHPPLEVRIAALQQAAR